MRFDHGPGVPYDAEKRRFTESSSQELKGHFRSAPWTKLLPRQGAPVAQDSPIPKAMLCFWKKGC